MISLILKVINWKYEKTFLILRKDSFSNIPGTFIFNAVKILNANTG